MARLAPCPRCGGWCFLEPDYGTCLWAVCINCGWEDVHSGRPYGDPGHVGTVTSRQRTEREWALTVFEAL
jgi:hypothetical protein